MPAGFVAIALLAVGITLVIVGAEAFFSGLTSTAIRLGVSSFFFTILVSGLEVENIAAGLAANLAGFPGAAAGTFLGGTTFIALGVAGIGAILAPFHAPSAPSAPVSLVGQRSRGATPVPGAGSHPLPERRGDSHCLFLVTMFSLHRTTGESGTGQLMVTTMASGKAIPGSGFWRVGRLTIGGETAGNGLQAVVSRLGLSATLIGNTAIAALTEAEEIGRIAVPARRGRPDVATANIGGTVIHFLTLNAGISGSRRPTAPR
jgi:Ca2+/Na+ antiporter